MQFILCDTVVASRDIFNWVYSAQMMLFHFKMYTVGQKFTLP